MHCKKVERKQVVGYKDILYIKYVSASHKVIKKEHTLINLQMAGRRGKDEISKGIILIVDSWGILILWSYNLRHD